ncbi:hypothetical protein HK102_006068 [Quaeritorhiza haematococci]|nr:hypothetical protein HK102_006068 [Quaeritorhiza haematococci]
MDMVSRPVADGYMQSDDIIADLKRQLKNERDELQKLKAYLGDLSYSRKYPHTDEATHASTLQQMLQDKETQIEDLKSTQKLLTVRIEAMEKVQAIQDEYLASVGGGNSAAPISSGNGASSKNEPNTTATVRLRNQVDGVSEKEGAVMNDDVLLKDNGRPVVAERVRVELLKRWRAQVFQLIFRNKLDRALHDENLKAAEKRVKNLEHTMQQRDVELEVSRQRFLAVKAECELEKNSRQVKAEQKARELEKISQAEQERRKNLEGLCLALASRLKSGIAPLVQKMDTFASSTLTALTSLQEINNRKVSTLSSKLKRYQAGKGGTDNRPLPTGGMNESSNKFPSAEKDPRDERRGRKTDKMTKEDIEPPKNDKANNRHQGSRSGSEIDGTNTKNGVGDVGVSCAECAASKAMCSLLRKQVDELMKERALLLSRLTAEQAAAEHRISELEELVKSSCQTFDLLYSVVPIRHTPMTTQVENMDARYMDEQHMWVERTRELEEVAQRNKQKASMQEQQASKYEKKVDQTQRELAKLRQHLARLSVQHQRDFAYQMRREQDALAGLRAEALELGRQNIALAIRLKLLKIHNSVHVPPTQPSGRPVSFSPRPYASKRSTTRNSAQQNPQHHHSPHSKSGTAKSAGARDFVTVPTGSMPPLLKTVDLLRQAQQSTMRHQLPPPHPQQQEQQRPSPQQTSSHGSYEEERSKNHASFTYPESKKAWPSSMPTYHSNHTRTDSWNGGGSAAGLGGELEVTLPPVVETAKGKHVQQDAEDDETNTTFWTVDEQLMGMGRDHQRHPERAASSGGMGGMGDVDAKGAWGGMVREKPAKRQQRAGALGGLKDTDILPKHPHSRKGSSTMGAVASPAFSTKTFSRPRSDEALPSLTTNQGQVLSQNAVETLERLRALTQSLLEKDTAT